ncbi:MAG TPA: type II secretion system protein GspD [Myxococcales bacterium]|nr:type II secretion system protein GspD [Deltaproteobacteria bacterium]HAA55018.1 type II secretion system protein GspD [Myxococcales bacterium]
MKKPHIILLLICVIGCIAPAAAQARCKPQWRKRFRPPFQKEKLLNVVKWISEKTCYNFIVPKNIRGKELTILMEEPLRLYDVYRAFLVSLQSSAISIVRVGGYRKLIFTRNAKRRPIPLYLKGTFRHPKREDIVTYMLRVRHTDVNQLQSFIRQIVSPNGQIIPFQSGGVILLIDYANNIHRILKIVKKIDVESAGTKEKVFMIQVDNGQAQEIMQRVRTIFQVIPKNRLRGRRNAQQIDERFRLSKIMADERTNRIIVVCNKRAYENVKGLVRKLDIPLVDGGKIRVHYLRYAKAEEVAQTLSQLAQGQRTRRFARRGKKSKAPTGATAADLFQGEVRITADKGTNSLVIVSNQRDYENLMRVIRSLDLRRKQVFIEAVILEISLTKTRDLGAVFHGGIPLNTDEQNPEVAVFGTQLAGVNSLILDPAAMMGLALGLRGPEIPNSAGLLGSGTPGIPSFGVLLRALQTNTDVDIISTPHILTATNEEANIQVGQNVPFIAGTTFSSAGVGISVPVRNIQRQDVALTMKIKPLINAGDRIKMDVDLEVTEIAGQNPELGPTTTKRKIKTTIRVSDNQTAVIGGLMRDKVSDGVSKVPFLGDIPILGALFRVTKKSTEKQNLLVFLTPHIVSNAADFRRIFLQKMKERKQFLQTFYNGKSRMMKKLHATPLTGGLIDRIVHTTKQPNNSSNTRLLTNPN